MQLKQSTPINESKMQSKKCQWDKGIERSSGGWMTGSTHLMASAKLFKRRQPHLFVKRRRSKSKEKNTPLVSLSNSK
jgi:hypothetical protein